MLCTKQFQHSGCSGFSAVVNLSDDGTTETGVFSSPDNASFTGTRTAPVDGNGSICSNWFPCGEEFYRICVRPKTGLSWSDVTSCSDVEFVIEMQMEHT